MISLHRQPSTSQKMLRVQKYSLHCNTALPFSETKLNCSRSHLPTMHHCPYQKDPRLVLLFSNSTCQLIFSQNILLGSSREKSSFLAVYQVSPIELSCKRPWTASEAQGLWETTMSTLMLGGLCLKMTLAERKVA